MNIENISGEVVVENVVTLDETSATSIAVTPFRGALHLAWADAYHHINTLWSSDGQTFGDKRTLEHRSFTAAASMTPVSEPPWLTASETGPVMAWAVNARARRQICVAPPNQAVDPISLHQGGIGPPTIAAWGNELMLGWLGTDRRVNLARAPAHEPAQLGQPIQLGKAATPPALCTVGGELAAVWLVTKWFKAQLHVLLTQRGQLGQPIVLPGVAQHTPACSAVNGELLITWKERGAGNRLGFLRGGTLVPAMSLPDTRYRFGLCPHGDGLILAWPGDDQRINVARLLRTA